MLFDLDRIILFLRRQFHDNWDVIRYLLRRLFRSRKRHHNATPRTHHRRHRHTDHDPVQHNHEINEESHAMIEFILDNEGTNDD